MIRKISATRYLIVEAHSRLRGTLAPEHSAARSLTSPCRRGLGEDSSCICPVLSYNLSRSPEGRTGIDSSSGGGRRVLLSPSSCQCPSGPPGYDSDCRKGLDRCKSCPHPGHACKAT